MGLSQRGSGADLAPDAAQDLLSAPAEAPHAEPSAAATPAAEGSPNRAAVTGQAADRSLKGAGANGLQHGSSDASTVAVETKLEPKPSTASSEAESEASSNAQSAGMSPHYDAAGDIILRLEFLRTPEFKVGVLGGCESAVEPHAWRVQGNSACCPS
jgi:type IV secretory pathway TrbL component